MKNMLVDTSGRGLSVTICDENRNIISSLFLPLENTLSEKMLWAMDNLFKGAGLATVDIDRYIIVKGPGSFTGIRVGVAVLLGFCAAHGKILTGISSLDAAAVVSGRDKIKTAVKLRGSLYGFREYNFSDNVYSEYRTEKLTDTGDFFVVNSGGSPVDLSRAVLSDRFDMFVGDYAPMYMRPSEAEINFDKKCCG